MGCAKYKKLIALLLLFPVFAGCSQNAPKVKQELAENLALPLNVQELISPAAENTTAYLDKLKGKKVALVANQTSMIGNTHLVDSLLSLGINLVKVFAPEHGFRGEADAGEQVSSTVDAKTGLPLVSLYGSSKKPSAEQLKEIDLIVFDIQDVGVRFYTYISSLHYIMEAAAENNIPLLILDRPNPNGHYIDGPVLKPAFSSFIGMHPVPLVHGLTIGEYGLMINGEKWLAGEVECDLEVIPCSNYTHDSLYVLPIKPSPNLPNMNSIYLYPGVGLVEGTNASEGRGTPWPFQVCGEPGNTAGNFEFTPQSMPGAKDPKQKGKLCVGFDLRNYTDSLGVPKEINLKWIIALYNGSPDKNKFFMRNGFFNKLAGNEELTEQIKKGLSDTEIRKSWQKDLNEYSEKRKKYVLYDDF